MEIKEGYDIPEDLYAFIEKYLGDTPMPITNPRELISLWRKALSYREASVETKEAIAEWTVSAGASSPLVNDNDIYEAIHAAFGASEALSSQQEAEKEWQQIASLVDQAEAELRQK